MTKRFRMMPHCMCVVLSLWFIIAAGDSALGQEGLRPGTGIDTKSIPFKIVYESLRKGGLSAGSVWLRCGTRYVLVSCREATKV